MAIGLLINGSLIGLCGYISVRDFNAGCTRLGWMNLFASSWNLALVLKYIL